jgi:ATP-dependent DNA helicase RecG
MNKTLKRLKNLLNVLVSENFKLFKRVKDPEKVLSLYFEDLKPYLDTKRKRWVDKVQSFLETYPELPEDEKKKFLKELHTVLTLKFSPEEIERDREKEISKERVISQRKERFQSKKHLPIEEFFKPIERITNNKRASRLKKLGIKTLLDVLYFFPFRYEDRTTIVPISSLKPEMTTMVKGKVINATIEKTYKKRKRILRVIIYDRTGTINLIFLQERVLNYYKKLFEKAKELNKEVLSFGTVKRKFGTFTMVHPEIEIFDESKGRLNRLGTVLPFYHSSESLRQTTIRSDIRSIVNEYSPKFPEYLPENLIEELNLPNIGKAIWHIHFPENDRVYDLMNFKTSYQQRVIFDEFFIFQAAILLHRKSLKENKGIEFKVKNEWVRDFENQLPFNLTDAQKKVIKEIINDMQKQEPMNRLIQGDVGSGKTVVAALSAFIAAKNGYQVAIMAPTEILARQHFQKFNQFLKNLNLNIGILTGSLKKKEKQRITDEIKSGNLNIVIGTHAIIQEHVEFRNLGLVIVDEQHRFGVRQRAELKKKGRIPDVLVMTATPIPRTLAMTVYGDLDISIIDELPKGRKPIITKFLFEDERERIHEFLKGELLKGHRVYIIYPLIDESDKLELKAATMMYDYWKQNFKEFKVGLLHGRMKQEEKDKAMGDFKTGEIQILISTTVVEVGVDVPEATVMIIEHAERFGLAQLHQLRGRVGRGKEQSFCFLIASRNIKDDAIKRLKVLENTNNGFKVAEEDLNFRGPGEIFGTRQSGIGDFKIADILRDYKILSIAREKAANLIENNPHLKGLENLKKIILNRYGEKFDLIDIG